jgi:hypothetical protein
MEFNNYEWFITQTVESMLPRFSDPKIVLTMKIDAKWIDYGYDTDGNKKVREESRFGKTIFLVFHRPHNYTKVLYTEIDMEDSKQRKLPCAGEFKMKQVADHDSCWRSDGMNWIFKTFNEAWEFFEEKGIEGRSVFPSFHYSIFGGEPQYWSIIDLKPSDPSDKWGSDYIISFARRIYLDEISLYMKNTN